MHLFFLLYFGLVKHIPILSTGVYQTAVLFVDVVPVMGISCYNEGVNIIIVHVVLGLSVLILLFAFNGNIFFTKQQVLTALSIKVYLKSSSAIVWPIHFSFFLAITVLALFHEGCLIQIT